MIKIILLCPINLNMSKVFKTQFVSHVGVAVWHVTWTATIVMINKINNFVIRKNVNKPHAHAAGGREEEDNSNVLIYSLIGWWIEYITFL